MDLGKKFTFTTGKRLNMTEVLYKVNRLLKIFWKKIILDQADMKQISLVLLIKAKIIN
jgi:hypothetical protein